MTKTNIFAFGRGWDRIADLNLFSGNNNAVNEQLDELPFLFKGGLAESVLHTLAEGFNRLHHSSKLVVMPYIGFQLPLLFSNNGQSLFQFLPSPLVFFELQHIG
jgi:hypothetical protein